MCPVPRNVRLVKSVIMGVSMVVLQKAKLDKPGDSAVSLLACPKDSGNTSQSLAQ